MGDGCVSCLVVMNSLWMERGAARARMEEGYVYVCIYSRGDSHPCCAVLQDFLQLGFLGEAVCPSGLASV